MLIQICNKFIPFQHNKLIQLNYYEYPALFIIDLLSFIHRTITTTSRLRAVWPMARMLSIHYLARFCGH